MKKEGKLKLCLKVSAVILILLIIIVAVAAYWQRENLMAMIDAAKYSPDEITSQMAESKKTVAESLEKYNLEVVRDFTPEEEDMLLRGKLTAEEAISLIKQSNETGTEAEAQSSADGSQASVNLTANNTPVGSGADGAGSDSMADDSIDAKIGEKISEMYSLKAYYLGQLGSLASSAVAEYKALPESKKNASGMQQIASKYMGTATGLESECDGAVNSILAELEAELAAAGEDTSIVSTIKNAYIKEKGLKKSYYLSMLKS